MEWQSGLVTFVDRCLGRAIVAARVVAGDPLAMDGGGAVG
jgi:hypothetical protein